MAIALGTNTVVTVFGGSGFLGRYVVQALARAGCRIKVAVRRPDLALHLQPLGATGQIALIQANVRDERSVQDALRGADAAINLVGILQQSGQAEVPCRPCGGRREDRKSGAYAWLAGLGPYLGHRR